MANGMGDASHAMDALNAMVGSEDLFVLDAMRDLLEEEEGLAYDSFGVRPGENPVFGLTDLGTSIDQYNAFMAEYERENRR